MCDQTKDQLLVRLCKFKLSYIRVEFNCCGVKPKVLWNILGRTSYNVKTLRVHILRENLRRIGGLIFTSDLYLKTILRFPKFVVTNFKYDLMLIIALGKKEFVSVYLNFEILKHCQGVHPYLDGLILILLCAKLCLNPWIWKLFMKIIEI